LTPSFTDMRMLWYGLNGAVLLVAGFVVAFFLGPHDGTRALLLSPLVWLAVPTLNTLQKGNVQAVVIAASMLAMVLFERRRFAAGGAVLAFATVSKLYPGLLVLYLLVRRQWRAAAWTVGLGAAFSALSKSATSQHLRVLREAGLVRVRSEGNLRYYRADLHRVAEVRRALDSFWAAVDS